MGRGYCSCKEGQPFKEVTCPDLRLQGSVWQHRGARVGRRRRGERQSKSRGDFRPTSCPLANPVSHDFRIIQILAPSHHPPCHGPSPGLPWPVLLQLRGLPTGLPGAALPFPTLGFHAAIKKPFCKPTVNSLLCSKPSQNFPSHLESNSKSSKGTAPTSLSLSFLAPSLCLPRLPPHQPHWPLASGPLQLLFPLPGALFLQFS